MTTALVPARLASDGSAAICGMCTLAASCSAVVPETWAHTQVQGLWKVQARLRPYRDNILTLLEQIPTWSIQWIPRWVSALIRGGRLLTTHCDMSAEGAWSVHAVGHCCTPQTGAAKHLQHWAELADAQLRQGCN